MHNETPQSGSSDPLPPLSQRRLRSRPRASVMPAAARVSAYPALLPLASAPEVRGLLCYVIKHYGTNGLSVAIERRPAGDDVDVSVVYGDWRGNRSDVKDGSQGALAGLYFQEHHLLQFIETMRLTGVQAAQFYLAIGKDEMVLTDIRLGPYKLTGPGMVRDIFGRIIKTQEVAKIEQLDDAALSAVERGFGSYAGDLIIKPSLFRTVERRELGACPLYVEVRR